MAVHIPLSPEAQIEASTLMLASNNILSPAHGAPIAVPTQDMVLGCYYLTKARPGTKGEGRTFASTDDVLIALEMGEVETLTPIKLRYTGKVIDLIKAFDNQNVLHTEPIEFIKQYMDTTVGRVILNDVAARRNALHQRPAQEEGPRAAGAVLLPEVRPADHRADAGRSEEARLPLRDPRRHLHRHRRHGGARARRPSWCSDAEKAVIEVEQQYQEGAITQGERYNKIIEIWSKVTERVSDEMFKSMEEDDRTGRYLNPIYIMADSGARGSKQQIRQLSGMRGLMAKPSGEIIESPITANFREGLNVLQYFISTHGARKGLADTALKTADSGYLTRRLCDVAQDVIVTETDCGTGDGIYVEPIIESGEIIEPLRDRIVGRVALEDQLDYEGNVIVGVNQEITEDLAGGDSGGRYRAREDPLGADLRIEARRLPALLRPQPGHRPAGGARRSGRHHLGAVHRRTRNAAHHAYVPRRRNGYRIERAIQAGRQVRRLREVPRHHHGPQRQGRTDRHEPQRHHRHHRRQGPRKGTLPGGVRRQGAV